MRASREGSALKHHWFIGDIHGCYDAVRRLEDVMVAASERKGAEVHIVSLGDMVDRGPNSAGVVKHFRQGVEAGTHSAILGNHEEMMLRCVYHAVPESFPVALPRWVLDASTARKLSPRAPWLTEDEHYELGRLLWQSQGGTPALASWGQDTGKPKSWRVDPDDLAFLCSLDLIFECDAAVATHALAMPEELMLLRALALTGGSTAPRTQTELDTFQSVMWRRQLPKQRVDSKTHVSGHSVLRRVRRYPGRGLVRVDTGACFHRRLSAWCAETDESVSVQAFL